MGLFTGSEWQPVIVVIARALFPKIDPSTRCPSFANVAYARAISSGLTGSAPSPIAKYGCRWPVIPTSCAVRTTFAGPTSFVSCANTELSEYVVADARLIGPRYSPS